MSGRTLTVKLPVSLDMPLFPQGRNLLSSVAEVAVVLDLYKRLDP